MTTARDICDQALKKSGVVGVGQVGTAEDINDAFTDLNNMIAQWQVQRWLVYHLVTLSLASTGATSYTIGPGGDFNFAVRPDRIASAFARQQVQSQPNHVDYPLERIEARETYNLIALKTLQTFPQYYFYDSGFPLGTIYFWPVPQNIYSMHVSVKAALQRFVNLTEELVLPDEYEAALKWNLAVRIQVSYQIDMNPALVALAKESLNIIRGANTQIARLQMPSGLVFPARYNPFSDRLY